MHYNNFSMFVIVSHSKQFEPELVYDQNFYQIAMIAMNVCRMNDGIDDDVIVIEVAVVVDCDVQSRPLVVERSVNVGVTCHPMLYGRGPFRDLEKKTKKRNMKFCVKTPRINRERKVFQVGVNK